MYGSKYIQSSKISSVILNEIIIITITIIKLNEIIFLFWQIKPLYLKGGSKINNENFYKLWDKTL